MSMARPLALSNSTRTITVHFRGSLSYRITGLTGNFSLQVSAKGIALNGSTNFSVEEYKRPKFETYFEPITETYKVNDSISVNGTAIAFAGSKITDAKVRYRVKRAVYFPRWYYWRYPYYNNAPQEIAHGATTTDASGNYTINFKALPDNSVSKKNLPTFNYEVTADVTDINGETHSCHDLCYGRLPLTYSHNRHTRLTGQGQEEQSANGFYL